MSWANSYYTNFLNQTRLHVEMLPDPNGQRMLNPTTPAKWALLAVLSTRASLSLGDIRGLFWELSYQRSTSAINRGLQRLLKFGLAVVQKGYKRSPRRWTMTERGKQLAAPKPKKPKTNQPLLTEG